MDTPSKMVKAVDAGDRITGLPDELRHHVLSFLPARDAARTCVLSPMWRQLWESASRLNVDDEGFSSQATFIKFVNALLLSRGSIPLNSFWLLANGPDIFLDNFRDTAYLWICYAPTPPNPNPASLSLLTPSSSSTPPPPRRLPRSAPSPTSSSSSSSPSPLSSSSSAMATSKLDEEVKITAAVVATVNRVTERAALAVVTSTLCEDLLRALAATLDASTARLTGSMAESRKATASATLATAEATSSFIRRDAVLEARDRSTAAAARKARAAADPERDFTTRRRCLPFDHDLPRGGDDGCAPFPTVAT